MVDNDNYTVKKCLSRFPKFHYKEVEDLKKEKEFSEEATINSLKILRNQFELLTNELKNVIDLNTNNFNMQSKLYKRNTPDYLILSNLDLQLTEIILYKLSKENEIVFDKNKIINDIKNKYEDNTHLSLILKRVTPLLDKFEKIYNSNNKLAVTYLNVVFNYIICYMKDMLNQLKLFKDIKIEKDNNNKYSIDDEIVLIDLIFMLEKLDSIGIFISSGYFVDNNDIINQKEDSDDWNNLNRIGWQIIPKNEAEIRKKFHEININSEKLVAAIINSYNEESYKITNVYKFLSNYIKYGNDNKIMFYESKKAQLIQNRNITKEIMDMVLWPSIKKLGERNYQKIYFRKKLYVKKEYPDITLENIQKLLKLMGNNYIDVSNINQEIVYKNENDIINNKEIPKGELYKNKVPKNIKKYYVSTTLLHSSYITFPEEKKSLKYSIMNSIFEYNKPNDTKDNLMIFIHGGGFVGMNTHFHESFLREWANELKIPIIGINYGLAPKHKYPYGLNDCYQAYRWILNHSEDVLGIKIKKLILGGDSLGGSFILSLIFLLIAKNEFENENIRFPDLLITLYPRCNTSSNIMGASLLLSIKDFLLNDKFLLYVNEAYRDSYPNDDDPFLNPVQAKECILKIS